MNAIDKLSDHEIIARTAYGECRGGGSDGMQSVINVIMNRAKNPSWWGTDPRSVCLKPYQFSCWIPGTLDYQATLNDPDDFPSMANALNLAQQAINGTLTDMTNGACYYIAASINPWPHWCEGHTPCANIASQLFFNDID